MTDRETTVIHPPGLSRDTRQIRKACKHVNDLWFPVNPALLTQIKRSLREGIYGEDVRALVKDVAGDFSLFLYCLRELSRMLREEDPDADPPENLSPHRFIEWAGMDRLKVVLTVEATDISSHSFNAPTNAQTIRLEESLISVSSAQVLAERYALDPEMAFSAGLLRQLGYTLIAWNYPVVYQKAIVEVSQGKPLDVSLTQMFGFSPSLLALNVAKKWELPKALWGTIVDVPDELIEGWSEKEEVKAIQATLVKITKTGEALARANNPRVYPSAQNDWEFARVQIEEALGPDGMKLIQSRLSENCLSYVELTPHVFTPAFVLDPEGRITESRTEEMNEANPFVVQCAPALTRRLTQFYLTLRPGEISRDKLTILAKEIIPSVGFHEGCVYTIDPASNLLVPQLTIGRSTLKQFSVEEYAAAPQNEAGVMTIAFQSDDPIVKTVASSKEWHVVQIAGCLGTSQRIGALLLQMRHDIFQQDTLLPVIHFRALAQAFNDCLGLK